MDVRFEEAFLAEVVTAEALRRALDGRLKAMAAYREADGIDATSAVLDAAESLGLAEAVRTEVLDALGPLAELEIEHLVVRDSHGGMPECRRDEDSAQISVAPGPVADVCGVLAELRRHVEAQPDRMTVQLPVGLGGTGGCACGEDLPEDAAPGPLFERR
jgi:hypothetical protein